MYAARGIGPDQLPPARVEFLPVDEVAEAKRVAAVDASIGRVAPGVVQNTTDALFRDLWLRPGLAPPEPQPGTVSALVATVQVD